MVSQAHLAMTPCDVLNPGRPSTFPTRGPVSEIGESDK